MFNKYYLNVLFFSIAAASVHAAAIDDMSVATSTDLCDGFNPADHSFVVYATNANPGRRVSANFQYDSNPAAQKFTLYDADLSPFTDRYPKLHEQRFAPKDRAAIGCTVNYRPSSQPKSVTVVPILIAKAGAVYIDPSQPDPPAEKARDFISFFPQTGFGSTCPAGARPAALMFVINMHPYLTASVSIPLSNGSGGELGELHVTLPPLAATRAGCGNGTGSPINVRAAEFSPKLAASMAIQTAQSSAVQAKAAVQAISATFDRTGSHPGTAAVSGPSSVTCTSATSDLPRPTYPSACFINAPGYGGQVNPRQTIGTSGAGTVVLTCQGQGNLRCSARIG